MSFNWAKCDWKKIKGGKWDRRGHAFPENPTEKLQAVVEAGEVVEPKKNGCFYTPKALADQVVILAGI